MKNLNKYLYIILIIAFSSCYKEPAFEDFDYKTYNRVVGPRGGLIKFFSNYDDDKINQPNVEMEFPKDALDSMMVFNMYQFEDYELVIQMEGGYATVGSRFLYFVPFYESEGYYKRNQLDLSYHLSSEFNQPVKVRYYFLADKSRISPDNWQEAELHNDYYEETNRSYKLFRIKIPKVDEWGEFNNIYVNWNKQGYPDGYDRTDLFYIINGTWSAVNEWGTGSVNLENWQLVDNYFLNEEDTDENKYVEFEIENTDYMYVLARIIYVSAENVPLKLQEKFSTLFPDLEIERAAFDGEDFWLYLSDNSVVEFTRNGEFTERVLDNISLSEVPPVIASYLSKNYSNQNARKIKMTQKPGGMGNYRILMNSGIILYFNLIGDFIGSFEYDIDVDRLPQTAISYLSQNHSHEAITNITLDNEDAEDSNFIVYLSSNTKVFFELNGDWDYTVHTLKQEDLPEAIDTYFKDLFNEPDKDPNYTLLQYTTTEMYSFYEVSLIDESYYLFNEAGQMVEMERENMKEEMLPPEIAALLDLNYPDLEIVDIEYYSYDYGQDAGYQIEFEGLLYLELDTEGNIKKYYGRDWSHFPAEMREYVKTNYSTEQIMYCDYDIDLGYEIEFMDNLYIYLNPDRTLKELDGNKMSHLPQSLSAFITNYYPTSNLLNCYFSAEGDVADLANNEQINYFWDITLDGGVWLGFDANQNFLFMTDTEVVLSDLILPIQQFLTTNFAGVGVYESYYYYSQDYMQEIYYLYMEDYSELVFDSNGVLLDRFKKATKAKSKKASNSRTVLRKKIKSLETNSTKRLLKR